MKGKQETSGRLPDSLRVCIVNEFFYPDDMGGTGSVLTDLAESMRATHPNVQIDVITSRNRYRSGSDALAPFEEWQGIRIFRVSAPSTKGLGTVSRLAVNVLFSVNSLVKLLWECRHGKYDSLIVGTAPPTIAAMAHLVKRLCRIPYLYIIYDLDPDRAIVMKVLEAKSTVARILRKLQYSWLHQAGHVVVLGRCMKDYLRETYALPSEQVSVIPIGADPASIVPLPKNTAFRKKHDLSGFIVCYSGNFGRYHDFDTILDAAKSLSETNAPVTFVLVGGGAQHARVEERVRDEKITNVRVFPFVDTADYADLLATADASLVTLEPGMEGLCVPSKFYSILASGRPTIGLVSPKSEVALVLAEHHCGIQVNTGDKVGLAKAVTQLVCKPMDAEAMGENARSALVSHFASPLISDQYYEALRIAAGIGVRPPEKTPVAQPEPR